MCCIRLGVFVARWRRTGRGARRGRSRCVSPAVHRVCRLCTRTASATIQAGRECSRHTVPYAVEQTRLTHVALLIALSSFTPGLAEFAPCSRSKLIAFMFDITRSYARLCIDYVAIPPLCLLLLCFVLTLSPPARGVVCSGRLLLADCGQEANIRSAGGSQRAMGDGHPITAEDPEGILAL